MLDKEQLEKLRKEFIMAKIENQRQVERNDAASMLCQYLIEHFDDKKEEAENGDNYPTR